MEETVFLPSPNWFLVSGVAVTRDGWVIYSGPSKSLCVLEPLPSNYDAIVQSKGGFKAHVVSRAHAEKIISIDISPEWPNKRSFLTGSADGSVKQWLADYDDQKTLQVKTTHLHDEHKHEKEEIAGLGYSNETFAVTVGVFGNIVKWDISSNVVKNYSHFLKSFKPTCISCSRHSLLHVAVGTKQGVVFVIDLNAPGQILYKMRSHDEEITNISWCPQFEVQVKKSLNSTLSSRLEKIRNEPEPDENVPELKPFNTSNVKTNTSHIKNMEDTNGSKNLNESEIVEEDDFFDMYKDHAADEFGHKKYEPQDIYVKVKTEKKDEDFLAECLKLKKEILKRKDEPEPSIESLVEALDNTHVASGAEEVNKSEEVKQDGDAVKDACSLHIQRHLLAAIGKHGNLKILSKSGKLVSSCVFGGAGGGGAKHRAKPAGWPTAFWLRPDTLLAVNSRGQLLEINPLKIDCKNKLEYKVVHTVHKRGLYCIASGAPRVYNSDGDWSVWTAGQDRQLVEYSLKEKAVRRNYMTCGGFVYGVVPCPYDARKIALSVGDGAVRVWEADEAGAGAGAGAGLEAGRVTSHWQNVQGKVLTVAWHPAREGMLAFATAEARVGIIDTSAKTERPAAVLQPAAGGVYSLCWGEGSALLAAGGGALLRYHTDRPDDAPTPIPVEVEGVKWKISSVCWSERAMLVGSQDGAVAALSHSHDVLAAAYPFSKIIHGMDWHPQQVSSSSEDSQYKNLIAVTSNDKSCQVAILEFSEKEGGGLSVWKSLSGHSGATHVAAWSPHHEARLLTSSQDGTVRVWDVCSGSCVSVFGGHAGAALGAAWSPRPALAAAALTGGADCCLRLWDLRDHPTHNYTETKAQTATKKDKKKKDKTIAKEKIEEDDSDDQLAARADHKLKVSKKTIMPITYKKISSNSIVACRKLLNQYLEKEVRVDEGEDPNSDFIRLFGSINEVNDLLDEEMSHHLSFGNVEAHILLGLLRGHVAAVIDFAAQRDLLCPFLLSQAPTVSFKYWKDVTQMYLAQIDRLVAKGEQKKLEESRSYGGALYRRVAAQLSVHDARAAVAALQAARLHKEAYALCRVRHMDSIAEEVLSSWAQHSLAAGALPLAAACYIALGDLKQASLVLGKSTVEEHLRFAAEVAKLTEQTTFADHITEKIELIKAKQTTEETLQALPTRMELLMKEENADGASVDQ